MESVVHKRLIKIKRLFKDIRKNYNKSKCTAREIEIMIFIYLNPNITSLQDISKNTGLLESVISKYIKNLVSASFFDCNKRPTDILINIFKEFSQLNDIYLFIKRFREIYDEKTCTALEIELLAYIFCKKNGVTITEIYTHLDLSQSVVSKFVKKMEELKLLVKQKDRKIKSTKKLLNYMLFSLLLGEDIAER